jgi:hypothetical protein
MHQLRNLGCNQAATTVSTGGAKGYRMCEGPGAIGTSRHEIASSSEATGGPTLLSIAVAC